MPMKLPSAQKRVLWVLEKSIFCFFANFSLKKLKPLFGKVRQSIQSHLNQSLVIGMFLENGFEAILSSKTSVVIVWKEHFSVFCKLFSDKVETIFWESEAKHSRLLKLKCGCRSFLQNGFEATWSWNTMYWAFEKSIFQFFANFWVTKLKPFAGKVMQSVQSCLNENLVLVNFLENGLEATFSSEKNVLTVSKDYFSVFYKFFNWRSWNHFWRKLDKAFKAI